MRAITTAGDAGLARDVLLAGEREAWEFTAEAAAAVLVTGIAMDEDLGLFSDEAAHPET